MQIVDGAPVDFDDETNNTVATGRLRFRNFLTIDKDSGTMAVTVQVSDLVYSKCYVKVAVDRHQKMPE